MFLEVFVEGASDAPVVREILSRRFELSEGAHFRVHPHAGKGQLPANPNSRPNPKHRGLLDQLPAKLRGYAHTGHHVVVLVDADDTDCRVLLNDLHSMYKQLRKKPQNVLFRIAVEEIESWFIADHNAVKRAYPRAKTSLLPSTPDQIIGAWEQLAAALGCAGANKSQWAQNIAPHLDLNTPRSPSLQAFIRGIGRIV